MEITKCSNAVKRDHSVIANACRIPYYPLVISSAEGSIVEDIDGNRYIDLLSSGGALNIGHANPKVMNAIAEQVHKFIHYTTAYFYHEPMIHLAEKLIEITPGDYKKRVAFGLSGSDANDGAIKFARAYSGRSKIVTFIGAYHGSTYGSMTMSAITSKMRRKMGPFLPDVYSFSYPYCYRCMYGKNETNCHLECLEQMKTAFSTYIPAEEVAAVIIEPIQGDGGMIVPPAKYINHLYALCSKYGILFISEEVQQGFGRTGKWFGINHFEVTPDLVVLGKSIASGMPLSAIVGREEIMQAVDPSGHVFTTAANPVCCCAALSTIDVISEKGFFEHVDEIGSFVIEHFNKMKERYEIIGDVRGIGLSIGVELIKDAASKEKNSEAAAKICYRCYEKGVIIIYLNGNILRIQPPLIITKEEMLNALDIIDSSIGEYLSGGISDDVLKLTKGWE